MTLTIAPDPTEAHAEVADTVRPGTEAARNARRLADLESQNRLLLQLCEALGDYNRYLASVTLGRPATDNEAFCHYVLNGGKQHFDQTHPPRG